MGRSELLAVSQPLKVDPGIESCTLLRMRSMPPPAPTLIAKSVAKPGSPSQSYERNTWPELERLARDMPESGVHFQGT